MAESRAISAALPGKVHDQALRALSIRHSIQSRSKIVVGQLTPLASKRLKSLRIVDGFLAVCGLRTYNPERAADC
jgi:hypothetical protein